MDRVKTEEVKELSALEFLNVGLASHALCLLEDAGLLEPLKNINGVTMEEALADTSNPPLVYAAIITLVGAKVLKWEKNKLILTELGISLVQSLGFFQLPFKGYIHLLAKQYQLLNDPQGWQESDVDYETVALASINFGMNHLDPTLINVIKNLHPTGTICDLGCGTAEKLVKICKATCTNGLGFDRDQEVIKNSEKYVGEYSNVEVIQADIAKLKGVWEDVELGLISFVLHDFEPYKTCLQFLNSLKTHFPRMKCLIVVDIVTASSDNPSIMPGFDYVHGLQGIIPRNYQQYLEIFSSSSLAIRQEIAVDHMPNTYIWVLEIK